MSSIGPQIPPHILKQLNTVGDDNDEDNDGPRLSTSPISGSTDHIGPQIPAHLLSSNSRPSSSSEGKVQVFDDEDEDDGPQPGPIGPSIGPTIPPEVKKQLGASVSRPVAGPSISPPSASTSKRTLGPSLPNYAPTYAPNTSLYDDDSDDDDVGPKPLPAGMQHQKTDAVQEFLEREEKRRKLAEEAAKPKAPQRDEWMLVPPTSSGLLGNLDTTKLKARQFSRGTSAPSNSKNDTSLWTETPAERQQRLADEVLGKKRRVTDAPVDEDEDAKGKKRRRKQEEEVIRRGVDEHTRKQRGAALVDQHASVATKPSESEVPGIWDHSRDMGLGGRLMDDEKRSKMLKEAKGLGDRFGSGKSGGFL
ncbi:hypothetical protein GALMADRAFT_78060 [Galerina marginata CBS 339.88]|uniref:DUF3752 domain-containing protein n=1 Tax=Galerina marginata (strain CBS 339.88) TaxID=685588 RepID=A0A067SD16_GALM3|nr:hypothetical protein GALMADRAFT_78060 [Galerina marginata CBS 339.88]